MRAFAFWMSVATILTLNAVLWLVLLDAGDTLLFGRMITVLHVVLPISSLMMLVLLAKDRYWPGVGLFTAVIIGMLAVAVMGITGPAFSQGLHAVLDLCALNAYLLVVPRYWPKHSARAAQSD